MQEFNTKIWIVDNVDNYEGGKSLNEAAELLIQNEVIAFPTETVYGLGGNATSEIAIKKIFEAKGRPSDNPLIVHIADKEQLDSIVSKVSEKAAKLMEQFWPGPLTLVLPKSEGVATNVTAGLDTVAVRMPDHPIALKLIEQAGLPIAAPSANQSGKPSPTSAQHVYEDLNGRIPGIINGGVTGVGVESTVLDCSSEPFMILRPGGITKEQIENVIGEEVAYDPSLHEKGQAPKSPGMKYTHYAPNSPLHIVDGSPSFFRRIIKRYLDERAKIGLLISDELALQVEEEAVIFTYGPKENPSVIAQRIYEGLRHFNKYDVDVILAEAVSREGVGQAVMNRLEKAAGGSIFYE